MELAARCRYCGSPFQLEVDDYLELASPPVANGAQPKARRPSPPKPRTRHLARPTDTQPARSPYFQHLSEGRRAGKSVTVINAEWRAKKAVLVNGQGAHVDEDGGARRDAPASGRLTLEASKVMAAEKDYKSFMAWATDPEGGGMTVERAGQAWRER